ncbi:hypothetical protein [Nocardia sp. IFM 10818]
MGVWVVWLHQDRVLGCEWATRQDAELAGGVPLGADTAVVIAVAPSRMEQPVVGRVEVMCEYLTGKGIRAHAVHVRALREGALWTTLRGRALAGVVPAVARPAPTRPHRVRVPHRRAGTIGARPRMLLAACTVAATLMCGSHAAGAPPVGQPGLISEPPSTGQAGLIAAPSPAAPAISPGEALTPGATTSGNVEILAESSGPNPGTREQLSASPSRPIAGPRAPVQTVQAAEEEYGIDAPSTDVVRVGAVSVPRPEWMPAPLAVREQQWNDYLANQAAAAHDQSGLPIPAAEELLGTDADQAVPEPIELAWVQEVAIEPQAWVPVAAEAVDTVVSVVAGPPPSDPWQVLAQLPVWGQDGLS